jgi:type IV secretion system protein VirB2
MKKNIKVFTITTAILLISVAMAHASTSGMPWDTIGTKIIDGLSSKFTAAIAAVAIFGAGLTLMFGEGGGFSQKALKIAFGIGIILAAANVASSWFGASGCLF